MWTSHPTTQLGQHTGESYWRMLQQLLDQSISLQSNWDDTRAELLGEFFSNSWMDQLTTQLGKHASLFPWRTLQQLPDVSPFDAAGTTCRWISLVNSPEIPGRSWTNYLTTQLGRYAGGSLYDAAETVPHVPNPSPLFIYQKRKHPRL